PYTTLFRSQPRLELPELLLERPPLVEQLLQTRRNLEGPDLEHVGGLAERRFAPRDARERGRPGDGLDAPDARGDRALGRDLEQTDLAGAAKVRAAAQLGREVADLDHAHSIAVLFAEKRHRAGLERLVEIHLVRHDGRVGLHLRVP